MMKLKVDYPGKDDEVRVIDRMVSSGREPKASAVTNAQGILDAREVVIRYPLTTRSSVMQSISSQRQAIRVRRELPSSRA